MTRFAIDAPAAIRLAREGLSIGAQHQLVAPTLLRSEVLSILYREVRAGSLDLGDAQATLRAVTSMRIRLLGDRVSRGVAWRIAEEHGWDDTGLAEYVAVARLQADVFVTLDDALAREIADTVMVVPFEQLAAACEGS